MELTAQHTQTQQRDYVFAGICACIAQRFQLDPLAVRIAALLMIIPSVGTILLLYAAAWLVRPRFISQCACVSCDPCKQTEEAHNQPSCYTRPHTPEPPLGFGSDDECEECSLPDGAVNTHRSQGQHMSFLGLLCGICVACFGLALVYDAAIDTLAWWRLWPLPLLAVGLSLLVIPLKHIDHTKRFSLALIIMSFGMFATILSVGGISEQRLIYDLSYQWPVFVTLLGIGILSAGRSNSRLMLIFALGLFLVCFILLDDCGLWTTIESIVLRHLFA